MPGRIHEELVDQACRQYAAVRPGKGAAFTDAVLGALCLDGSFMQYFHADWCNCGSCRDDDEGNQEAQPNRRELKAAKAALRREIRAIAPVVPDAVRVDPDRKVVMAFEVEVAAPVRGRKLDRYINLFWLFDASDSWDLELLLVDSRDSEVRVFCLAQAAYEREARAN